MMRAVSVWFAAAGLFAVISAPAAAAGEMAPPTEGASQDERATVAEAEVNRLLVAAKKAFDQVLAAQSGNRLMREQAVLARLKRIADLYGATDKGRALAAGKEVAGLSIPLLEAAIAEAEATDLTTTLEETAAVAECDRLAADPLDPGRRTAGVWPARIEAAAVDACASAVAANPGNPRLIHQYARALDAAGQAGNATAQFKRAADAGSAAARTETAIRTMYGTGIPADEIAGLLLLKEQADGGEATAEAILGELFYNGRRFVSPDQARGIELYRQSALAGNPLGMVRLGRVYRNGGNPKAALYWIRKAAALGSPDARYTLATMLRDGEGTPFDLAEAVRLLNTEAEAGNTAAQNSYAILLDFGYGVAKDEKAAIGWYEKAAVGGSATAHFNLMIAYANGRHVTKNLGNAADHAIEAIRLGNRAAVDFVKRFGASLGRPFVGGLQARLSAEGLLAAKSGTFDQATQAALEELLQRAPPS